MPFTLRELIRKTFNPIRVSLWVAITIACVISGPFESGQADNFWASLGFWSLAIGYGIVLANAIELAMQRLQDRSFVLAVLTKSVTFSLFYAPFLYIALPFFFPGSSHVYAPPYLLAINAGGIYLVVVLVIYVMIRALSKPAPTEATPSPPILKRLPPAIGRDVQHVTSQDHYVEVKTKLGSELILMRFTDALDELEGLQGVRVHRSHWVAASAVARVQRSGTKVTLRLHDGTKVPVSRSYRAEATKAGLL